MKNRNSKKTLLLVFLTAANLLCQFSQILFNRIDLSSANGIFMAFEFLCCIGMLTIDYNSGIIISSGCMGLSLITILISVIRTRGKVAAPIAGLINTIIFLSILLYLVHILKKRDKEIVTDYLTGLYNRRGLYHLLNSKASSKNSFYVVYIDLGNFKLINDNYGHSFGDSILKSVTKIMTDNIGKEGFATRIGGDEFVLILNENSKVYQITQNILDEISQKLIISDGNKEDIELYITAYAGISKYPSDSNVPEELIKYADIAMYEASKNKNTRIVRFDQGMADKLNRQMEIEKLINEALEKDYFYMVYQPQYHLEGKKLRGFESLLRLKTADGVFVSPAEFIPVAEKKDLILKIDDYVIRRVMEEFTDIVKQSPNKLTISVNVSAKNIGNVKFPQKIKKLLDQTNFPAENLEIEITEYCLVQSVETTIENITQLREMGIQIALDDFGTGYTSLSYLAKMPINLLKVDKSLVDDIENNNKSQEFVNAVISLGHLMGCEVIAEGTETENQLGILKTQKCDFVQGYVWGKPLDYNVAKDLSMNP